jgi:hypothetical protein
MKPKQPKKINETTKKKPKSIVVSESQLERLISKLTK